jgi:hypothetical protein
VFLFCGQKTEVLKHYYRFKRDSAIAGHTEFVYKASCKEEEEGEKKKKSKAGKTKQWAAC